ncbi:unnamed protein product, partial [Medioppia subpectinata]
MMATNKMPEEVIISFVKNVFAVTIAREQLLAPTKEFVVGLYARFLDEFGMENVTQPDLTASGGIANIEYYETNIIVVNIYKSVSTLVANAGVPDMTFADVVAPKRVRTNRILSALCSLISKLAEIEGRFQQMETKFVDLPARRQAVEQRIRELKRSVEEKSMYLSANKSKTQASAQHIKELAEKYEEKRCAGDLLQEESRALKTTILAQREKISEIDIEMSKMHEEIHELEKQVVKSPERIQADTEEKETELESIRAEKKKLEKQYMESIRSVDHLKEASKSLTPSLDKFAEAFKDIESIRSECEKLSETKALVNSREERVKSLNVQIKEQEKTIRTLRQQMANNDKSFQQQIQTIRQINGGLKSELEMKIKKRAEEDKYCLEEKQRLECQLDALDAQHRAAKEKVDSIWKRHAEAMKSVRDLVEKRMKEVKAIKSQRKVVRNGITLIAFANVSAFELKESNDIYQEVRDSRNFTGKVVLVTGSAQGIGEGIVKLYSALGASVVITGRKAADISRVAKEAQELSPKKLKPLEVTADLTKDEDLQHLFNETIKAYKGLDVLVNNAGLLINSSATDKNFLSVLDKSEKIDLRASLELIRLSVPYLKKSNGSVVNICSTYIEHPQISYLGYDIAKAALGMATKVLSIELAPQGIRVNSVSPSVVQSHPRNESSVWELKIMDKAVKTTPLRRPGLPIDIAKGVVFLSSSDASFITGHNLVVDGGLRYNEDSDYMNLYVNTKLKQIMSAKDIYSEVKNSRDFTGKVVIVTGSSGGIGEGIAKLYSALGASVVITGRREDGVKRVAKECQELSPKKLKALEIPADLGKDGEAERVFNETIKTFKRLDVLVNNAGDYIKANATDDNIVDVLDRSLKVDVKASLTLIRLFEPYLKQSKGNVINITSVFTERPQKSYLGYQLAKQALEMSTTTLALELAPKGIRVNSVNIGVVRSHEAHPDPDVIRAFENAAKYTPLGRVGTTADVAKGVVFLSSSDASFI